MKVEDKCSRCGARINLEENKTIIKCQYCGKPYPIFNIIYQSLLLIIPICKKYRRYIVSAIIFLIVLITYINSRKIQISNFNSSKEALNACNKWKVNSDRKFSDHQLNNTKKNKIISKSHDCKFSPNNEKKYKSNTASYLAIKSISKDKFFGNRFNSYNRCVISQENFTKKYKFNTKLKIIESSFRCLVKDIDDGNNSDKAGIYLRQDIKEILRRYNFRNFD